MADKKPFVSIKDSPIIRYWDYGNNTCSPGDITIGNSYKKCYWICSKCGKSHERTPYNEQKSTLCRSCGSKKGIDNGYRARIAKSHSIADDPVLSKCWDYEHNTADPSKLAYRSNSKFKWICSECGKGFERTAAHMYDGQLCNDCTLKKRAKTHHDNFMKTAQSVADDPELLKCWDYEHNTEDPHDVPQKSNNYFYWKCPDCGKSFRRTGNNQYASLRLCDDCAMNIRIASHREYRMEHSEKVSNRPNMIAMWDYDKNDIAPDKVLAHSTTALYWWRCPVCGKSEQNTPEKKYNAKTCWDCGNKIGGQTHRKTLVALKGSFADKHPRLAKEWHPTLNGSLTPHDVTSGCGETVYWLCEYGHVYQATPQERVNRHAGCPECRKWLRTSFTEQAIAFYLSKAIDIKQEYKHGGFNFDIYIPSLKAVVEYDGMFWHAKECTVKRDQRKDYYCKKQGWRIIRVKESDKINKVDGNKIYAQRRHTDFVWLIDQVCLQLGILPPVDIDIERDTPQIIARLNPVKPENALSVRRPDLVDYWDYEANYPITPDLVSFRTSLVYSWKCPVCGDRWRQSPSRMTTRKYICQQCKKNIIHQTDKELRTD